MANRLIHSLAIVTPTRDVSGEDDEYGHPVPGEPDIDLVAGLVQPKSVREVALTSQAGAEIGDYTIFLARRELAGAAYIRFEPDDGDRYEITGVRDFNFGRLAHLEVDARRIRSEVLVTS
jgi:hypothetical protein